MTLDFVRLAEDLDDFVAALARERVQQQDRLSQARELLERLSPETLQTAIRAASNATWLLAEPEEPPGARHSAPAPPRAYTALATDGSSIDVNRHAAAACYVINIGHAWIDYRSGAVGLASVPELGFASDQLLRGDLANASKESAFTGNLLDAYRTAREFCRLAELAGSLDADRPLVALLDGQFVLWGLKESELSSSARRAIFDEGVLQALDALQASARTGGFALASYISRPGGREVTNALRIAVCPRDGGADCHDCPRLADLSRPCDSVAGGPDALLFGELLAEGERSAIFRRCSIGSDLAHADRRYEEAGHGLRFFYLRIPDGEIVRIEIPEWIAHDPAAVDLVHASVLDQCHRGEGYPVVLQEAHEQAVIDGADRRSFAALIERELELRGWWTPPSGKAWSKRRRSI